MSLGFEVAAPIIRLYWRPSRSEELLVACEEERRSRRVAMAGASLRSAWLPEITILTYSLHLVHLLTLLPYHFALIRRSAQIMARIIAV